MATISPPRRAPSLPLRSALEERRGKVPRFVAPLLTIVGVAVVVYLRYAPQFSELCGDISVALRDAIEK